MDRPRTLPQLVRLGAAAVALALTASCGGTSTTDSLVGTAAQQDQQNQGNNSPEALAPEQVPELGVLPTAGYTPPLKPADFAQDCDAVMSAAPAPPLRLAEAPTGVNPEYLCIIDGDEPLRVNLLYLPIGANAAAPFQDLMRDGAISVVTTFDNANGRVPLPGVDSDEPANNAKFGYVRGRLGAGVDSRVFRVSDDWVNVLWYARVRGVPVTAMVSAGGVTEAQAASIAADVVNKTRDHKGPDRADKPDKTAGDWKKNGQ